MSEKNLPTLPFVWRSIDGRLVTLETIGSDHAYNLMKMLWNELAKKYPMICEVDKTPDGLCSKVPDDRRAVIVVQLLRELHDRGAPNCLKVQHQDGYVRLATEIKRFGNGTKVLEEFCN